MKKVKLLICLFALSILLVPTVNALAATCPYGCNSVYKRSCIGFDGSYNTVQHGYYNTSGQLVYHGYKLYMGNSSNMCIHNVVLYDSQYSHVHHIRGHNKDVCGVSDVTSCTY